MNLKTSNALFFTSPQRSTKPNGRHHELIRESSAFVQQQTGTRKRALYIDQIRALMVALVIAIHVPAAFTVGWFGVRIPVEESVSAFTKGFFSWYGYAINSFIMYMMFLLSGYFVPRSVHKKGIICYLKERLIRLGIPFTAGLLLINNASTVLEFCTTGEAAHAAEQGGEEASHAPVEAPVARVGGQHAVVANQMATRAPH